MHTNWVSLFVTSCCGRPNAVNTCLRVAMVLSAVVEVMSKISGHLEWGYTSNINIFPRRGPASLCGSAVKETQATSMGAMLPMVHSSLPYRKYMPWPEHQCSCSFQATTSHCEQETLSHHSSMVAVQDFQEPLLQLSRNHHPNSPKQTLSLHSQLMALNVLWLQHCGRLSLMCKLYHTTHQGSCHEPSLSFAAVTGRAWTWPRLKQVVSTDHSGPGKELGGLYHVLCGCQGFARSNINDILQQQLGWALWAPSANLHWVGKGWFNCEVDCEEVSL